jgi:hypothetical protein
MPQPATCSQINNNNNNNNNNNTESTDYEAPWRCRLVTTIT